jgi:prepilin-type N-terminal cleavage/methylation domain-containing protein
MTAAREFMTSTRPTSRGFTLVELMISIAIALILILGVSRVFSYSTDAVGAGQALVNVSRDARAAAAVFARDLSGAVLNGSPCIILNSQQVYAFRNLTDYQAATNFYNGTNIPDPHYDELGNYINPANYGTRSHRIDTFSYFSQGRFRRQTANRSQVPPLAGLPQANFVADQTAPEAWIWYGHLQLPDNGLSESSVWNPGQQVLTGSANGSASPLANNNNLFTSQWILGRQVILLQPTDSYGMMYDRNGTPQEYLCRPTLNYNLRWKGGPAVSPGLQANSNRLIAGGNDSHLNAYATYPDPNLNNVSMPWMSPSLYPLDENTVPAFIGTYSTAGGIPAEMQSTVPGGTGSASLPLWTSRYDVANTSIAEYRNILKQYIEEMSSQRLGGTDFTVDWWDPLMTAVRYYGNPFIQKPLSPNNTTIDPNKQAAQLAPCFLAGCSQFIVEYAGDYLNQNPTTGAVINTYMDGPTDGQVDFVVDNNGNRQIRWYGLPRAVPNAGTITLSTALTGPNNTPAIVQSQNVYPLMDIWATDPAVISAGNTGSTSFAPFERISQTPSTSTTPTSPPTNWPASGTNHLQNWYPLSSTPLRTPWPTPTGSIFFQRGTGTDYLQNAPAEGSSTSGLMEGEYYTCAWGPYDRKPLMIRITITMDDPNNHLANGQTYQFVFRLGNGNGN